MIIECNEISQTVNQLLAAFDGCKKIKNEDLVTLVQLVSAIYTCNEGGPAYDTEVEEVYTPTDDVVVTYPVNTYHSISIAVISGTIKQTIGSDVITYPAGTVLNSEVTNLNQTAKTFTVTTGSTVVVRYLIETT